MIAVLKQLEESQRQSDPLSQPSLAKKTAATPKLQGKAEAFYRKLDAQFHLDGFDYRQIIRNKRVAIFEKRKKECPSFLTYEVIRIRVRKAFTVRDEFVPAAEEFPSSKAWGLNGFTLQNRKDALAKFFELTRQK